MNDRSKSLRKFLGLGRKVKFAMSVSASSFSMCLDQNDAAKPFLTQTSGAVGVAVNDGCETIFRKVLFF